MKFSAPCISIVALLLSCQGWAAKIAETRTLDSKATIKIYSGGGAITVKGWDKNVFKAEGQSSSDYSLNQTNELKFEVLTSDKKNDSKNDQITFWVPKDASLTIKSQSANVLLDSITGLTNAHSVNGNVSGAQLKNDITLSSVNGDVTLLQSHGKISLESINGKIQITESSGHAALNSVSGSLTINSDISSLKATSVGGAVKASLRQIENLQLSSTNGDVVIESALSENASLVIESVKGNIKLKLPEDVSANFDLNTHSSGKISNNLNDQKPTKKTSIKGEQLKFKTANGTANVVVNSIYGSIDLEQLTSEKEPPKQNQTEFDWKNVDTEFFDFAYVKPGTDFSKYKKVYISNPKIEFDKRWLNEFNITHGDTYQKRIKETYSKALKEELTKVFKKTRGFKVVEKKSDDVLIIIPKIEALYIRSPETPGIHEVMAKIAGQAAIDVTLYSSQEKAVVGLFIERRATPPFTSSEALSRIRAANERAFRRLFKRWSTNITKQLKKSN